MKTVTMTYFVDFAGVGAERLPVRIEPANMPRNYQDGLLEARQASKATGYFVVCVESDGKRVLRMSSFAPLDGDTAAWEAAQDHSCIESFFSHATEWARAILTALLMGSTDAYRAPGYGRLPVRK